MKQLKNKIKLIRSQLKVSIARGILYRVNEIWSLNDDEFSRLHTLCALYAMGIFTLRELMQQLRTYCFILECKREQDA